MSEFDTPSVIDGFSSVQAVRRSGRTTNPRFRQSRTTLPATDKTPEKISQNKSSAPLKIGHTIIPEKHEIICYECEYAFTLPGRIRNTICPKCHRKLDPENHIIENESNATIRTIGTIEIKSNAVLKGAKLTGRNIILAGDASDGTIRACGCLELCPGAKFDFAKIRLKDLRIRGKGRFTIRRKITCRNIEVEGKLKANIYSDGIATIRHGGLLQGEIHGPHLIVEEGGGLKAKVVIGLGG